MIRRLSAHGKKLEKLCCDWLQLISPPKIIAIIPELLLGKDKRLKSILMLEKQPTNCVYVSIKGESVMISLSL